MLSLFTIPKPFRGHVGDIQRNAIESWRALHPEIQIILVGDEAGVAEAAQTAGVEHVAELATNERGTPRLDSAFERVASVARHPLWCLVNADIVLLDDFVSAVGRVRSSFERFLMIGECRDLDLVSHSDVVDPDGRLRIRRRAVAEGRLRGYAAMDYFVFPRGEFGQLPPFLIGRACFDNWLVWRVRDIGDPVVDATRAVVAIHQSHDYSHVQGGKDEAYYGEEARYNEDLAGGRSHIYSLYEATHRLHRLGRPLPYWGSRFRARERVRVGRIRLQIYRDTKRALRQQARRLAEEQVGWPSEDREPLRLLGIFPRPTDRTTRLLDELSGHEDVDLTVLYAAGGEGPRPDGHLHYTPRRVQLPGAERLLGRSYDVHWAIWNSFRGLRPDCMLVAGRDGFAAQAALWWCMARRIPYLLLPGESGAEALSRRVEPAHVDNSLAARRAAGVLATDSTAAEVSELARAAVTRRAAAAAPLGRLAERVARR